MINHGDPADARPPVVENILLPSNEDWATLLVPSVEGATVAELCPA